MHAATAAGRLLKATTVFTAVPYTAGVLSSAVAPQVEAEEKPLSFPTPPDSSCRTTVGVLLGVSSVGASVTAMKAMQMKDVPVAFIWAGAAFAAGGKSCDLIYSKPAK